MMRLSIVPGLIVLAVSSLSIWPAPAGAEPWQYVGARLDDSLKAFGIPPTRLLVARKAINDDSLLIRYAPHLRQWSLKFIYNSDVRILNPAIKSYISRSHKAYPYVFVRTEKGLGKGRYSSDRVIKNQVSVSGAGAEQSITMNITKRDLRTIRKGYETGVSYFVSKKAWRVGKWRTYRFGNDGLDAAIARIEAAAARRAKPMVKNPEPRKSRASTPRLKAAGPVRFVPNTYRLKSNDGRASVKILKEPRSKRWKLRFVHSDLIFRSQKLTTKLVDGALWAQTGGTGESAQYKWHICAKGNCALTSKIDLKAGKITKIVDFYISDGMRRLLAATPEIRARAQISNLTRNRKHTVVAHFSGQGGKPAAISRKMSVEDSAL